MKIAVAGMAGRMGCAIARIVANETEGASLAGGIVRAEELAKTKAAFPSVAVSDNADEVLPLCDALIDFSAATATPMYAAAAVRHGKAFVSGVTGLDAATMEALREAGRKIPVLYSANMSLSLAVMRRLVEQAARMLKDCDYDVAILDIHHRMKKDSPSGTAKTLAAAVVAGNSGAKQPAFADIRAGYVVGEHEVMFAGQGEVVSLRHSVTDRDIFARGAVRAALWLGGRPAGFYGIDETMEISK